ncbi:MAG: segregation/condensation protein A [Candidatus Pacearchaeota archaeon]
MIKEQGKGNKNNTVGQEQLYDMLVSREVSWQAIIYDLIKTEQLDPWNIDLIFLAQKYLEKVHQLEEEHVFFISSKVLLAAAILLRIKSELLRENIVAIDEILFDRKKKTSASELIDSSSVIDFVSEDYEILPRTPIPRARKITLQELMGALDRAINTEHRRIRRELSLKRVTYDVGFVMPKKTVDIREKIKELYNKIKEFFTRKKTGEFLTFSELAGTSKDEKIACFLPVLHLDTQEKIYLEQQEPFSEINIWLKELRKREEAQEAVKAEQEAIKENKLQ